MNDKKQLAAMGEHMAEQPLCMAKRIEELEAQVRVMAGLLRETLNMVPAIGVQICDLPVVDNLLDRIDAALAGKMPAPVVPEGWQPVPVQLTPEMWDAMNAGYQSPACSWQAALAAAPSPVDAK